MRGPRTAMKSGPCSPQLEKALAQKRRPNIGINQSINKNKNKNTHGRSSRPWGQPRGRDPSCRGARVQLVLAAWDCLRFSTESSASRETPQSRANQKLVTQAEEDVATSPGVWSKAPPRRALGLAPHNWQGLGWEL